MSREKEVLSARKVRVPLGTPRLKLKADQRPGYVRRFINGTEARVQAALDAGYTFADHAGQVGDPNVSGGNVDLGSRTSVLADKSTGQKAYLMEIPADLYAEDQAAKRANLDQIDNRIKRGSVNTDKGVNTYAPQNGISFNTRNGKIDD